MNNYVFFAQRICDRKHGKNVRVLDQGFASGEFVNALRLMLSGLSWHIPFLSAFMLCAGLTLTSARIEAAYTVVEVAIPPGQGESIRVVRGLNGMGETVVTGRRSAFLSRDGGGLQNIAGRPGADHSSAFGINLAGQVVGASNTNNGMRAFRSLRTGAALDLGTLPGDSSSVAFAINDSGQSCGFSSGPSGVLAVIWGSAGASQALPGLPGSRSSRALAINNEGSAVGISDTASGPHAVLWNGGSVKDLGALAGHDVSEALGISNSGDVVGSSGDVETNQRRAVHWAKGGAVQDLGTLPGGTTSQALGVNDRGEVVGTSATNAGAQAFLWTKQDGMQNLNDLLTSRPGFVLTSAVAVTNTGRILAIGQDEIPATAGHEVAAEDELPVRVFVLTQ